MSCTAPIQQPPPAPLRGYVDTYYRNYKGKRLGPYHVRKWKVGRTVKREYIKPADLEKVKAACAANREKKKRRATASKEINIYIDNHSFLRRMLIRLDKGQPIRQGDTDHIIKISKEGCSALGRPKLRRHARIDYLEFTVDELVARLQRRLARFDPHTGRETDDLEWLYEEMKDFMGAKSTNNCHPEFIPDSKSVLCIPSSLNEPHPNTEYRIPNTEHPTPQPRK